MSARAFYSRYSVRKQFTSMYMYIYTRFGTGERAEARASQRTHESIAYLVIGANGNVRGKKVTSLARWPPNPSRCWALTWRTIGPMEDYWARSGGLLAEWPLSTSGGVFPLTRLTTDA